MREDRYPMEDLDDDDGTMPGNVGQLADAVIGHRIVSVGEGTVKQSEWSSSRTTATVLTLDNGKQVALVDTSDCCAFTELEGFFLDPASIDHVILGVGTTEGFTVWHIFADFGDVMRLNVAWSAGNPFFYGYGFDIHVLDEAGESGRG